MVALQEPEAPAAGSPPRERAAPLRAAVAAVAALPPLTQLSYLIFKGRDEWPYLFADDAYYYLGVARSIGAGDGSTFSGLTETNGYHPLWELALSGLAVVFRDPYSLVVAVVLLQGVLWLLLVREAVRIGRALGSEPAAVAGVALLGTLAVITGQLSFSGMESAPLLVLLMVAVRLIVVLPHDDDRAELRLGAVLALVALARLDAVLTIGPLAAVVVLRAHPAAGERARSAVRLLGPTAICLAIYVVVNTVVFGTATPVSGQAKSLGAPFANFRPIQQFLEAGQMNRQPLWLGAIALVLSGLALAVGAWRTSEVRRRLMGVVGAVLVGQVLLLGYLVVATSYQVWAWYFYGIALLLFCSGTLVARSMIEWLGHPARIVCLALGVAFAVVQIPAAFLSGLSHAPSATETATFLSDELPDDAVIAMGDRAGLVGYLADRPMLQLEGLMADADWLHQLEDGTALDRMIDEGVDYYVWSGFLPNTMQMRDGIACRILTEPRAGEGPKFEVTVCVGDRVFTAGEGHDQFTVYRFVPEHNK